MRVREKENLVIEVQNVTDEVRFSHNNSQTVLFYALGICILRSASQPVIPPDSDEIFPCRHWMCYFQHNSVVTFAVY